MQTLDKNGLQEALEDTEYLVLDMYADWCGPCRKMAPILEELSEEMGNNVTFAKVDIEKSNVLTTEYSVNSVPTFIVFHNGVEVDRMIGATSKENMAKFIEACIK